MSILKKKPVLSTFVILLVICTLIIALFKVPNPIGDYITAEAKANGIIEYDALEAHALAISTCTQCHTTERIKLYCPRCGPPFVAVIPHMQIFIQNYQKTNPDLKYVNITQYQAVAIVQVWNALVGNWESDFREQDIIKMIGNYKMLVDLYKTPVSERRIEMALNDRHDLKMGHMSNIDEMQKNLGKPENNPQPGDIVNPCSKDEMKGMDHMDHMDHSNMDHSDMDHSNH